MRYGLVLSSVEEGKICVVNTENENKKEALEELIEKMKNEVRK